MILPLSHFYPRISGYYYNIYKNVPLALAESIDALAKEHLRGTPHLLLRCPPDLSRKVYGRIAGTAEKGPPVQRFIFRWAVKVREEGEVGLSMCHRPLPLLSQGCLEGGKPPCLQQDTESSRRQA